MDNTLENRLKILRKENGYTQEDVANKLGLTKSAYGYYEQGKTVPDAHTLSKLANIFDVTTDYLLGRTDNPKLTAKDERSIQKDLKQIIDDFKTGQAGPVFYNGEELSKHDLGVLEEGMELILQTIKLKNKEKYTPKKYKKD